MAQEIFSFNGQWSIQTRRKKHDFFDYRQKAIGKTRLKKIENSARDIAIEILCLWATTHNSVDLLFHDAVHKAADIDRPLIKNLVYGTLRHKEYLDAMLRRFSRHPLSKMKPRTLMTLRIGIYQLLFLHRIPPSAAVNATVNTLKNTGQPAWLIGFANGLLRAVARQSQSLPNPESMMSKDPPLLNHPAWLTARWSKHFGQERMLAICRANNQEPELSIRVNSLQTSQSKLLDLLNKSGITAARGNYSPLALRVKHFPGGVNALPGYQQGFFQVQDEAAQLVAPLIGTLPARSRILDACAGLGGKTSHLAEILPLDSELLALEPDQRRFRLLQENLLRLGQRDKVSALHTSLHNFAARKPQPFDAILVDAPCSGTGVIRRQPDIRWNRLEENLESYQHKQLELLHLAKALLKPEGFLVYATCSLEPEENEEVIRCLLADHADLAMENVQELLPVSARLLADNAGFLRSAPDQDLDGFFAARLRRLHHL